MWELPLICWWHTNTAHSHSFSEHSGCFFLKKAKMLGQFFSLFTYLFSCSIYVGSPITSFSEWLTKITETWTEDKCNPKDRMLDLEMNWMLAQPGNHKAALGMSLFDLAIKNFHFVRLFSLEQGWEDCDPPNAMGLRQHAQCLTISVVCGRTGETKSLPLG